MSKLIIDFTPILKISPHPNADRLELAQVKGWQVVVPKDEYEEGDNVIFIPPDAVLSAKIHEGLGVTKYLAELPKHYGKPRKMDEPSDALTLKILYGDNPQADRPTARRVKAARLRGEGSYGLVIKPHIATQLGGFNQAGFPGWKGREDIAADLNILKWEPPVKATQGDVEPDLATFHKYTDIENFNNYPDVFKDREKVRITEKIHGTNCRLGYVRPAAGAEHIFVAGSHNTRRKEFDDKGNPTLYWEPFNWNPKIKDMLTWLSGQHNHAEVVIFGEIYGAGVQDMTYGHKNTKGFRAFDISLNGTYLDYMYLDTILTRFEIPKVPVLWTGPYSLEQVRFYTDGVSHCDGGGSIREGVVITPCSERTDPNIGRVILKSISVDYLGRKGGTDGH